VSSIYTEQESMVFVSPMGLTISNQTSLIWHSCSFININTAKQTHKSNDDKHYKSVSVNFDFRSCRQMYNAVHLLNI